MARMGDMVDTMMGHDDDGDVDSLDVDDEDESGEEEDEALDPILTPTPGLGPGDDIEEIVVQGQQSVGLETDAAVSVTAFDAVELTALGVQDVSDVASFTPNLEIRTAGATTPTFFIRGVGLNDFNSKAAGAIAIYVDGVPINAPALQLGQLFDVENVGAEHESSRHQADSQCADV